jgi:hypothetical protein
MLNGAHDAHVKHIKNIEIKYTAFFIKTTFYIFNVLNA